MPYIPFESRRKIDISLIPLGLILETADEGELNYMFSRILWELFERNKSYKTIHKIVGLLECVKLEFYRRKAAPYEDTKMQQNGDL